MGFFVLVQLDILKDSKFYENMFNQKPKLSSSPLERNDHPELDALEEVAAAVIMQYQSMIGALQWTISLGRFDICTAIMTLSCFHIAPQQGHIDCIKHVYRYLARNQDDIIHVRTNEPDYSNIQDIEYDWECSVYGPISELVPDDAPLLLGKPVVMTTYMDANLYHDLITGCAATGILHLVNSTPVDWYSKHQATVVTAMYGSEFVAACIADQVIDLHITLFYLGVPVRSKSYMFGDNQSVVTSSTIPHSGQ